MNVNQRLVTNTTTKSNAKIYTPLINVYVRVIYQDLSVKFTMENAMKHLASMEVASILMFKKSINVIVYQGGKVITAVWKWNRLVIRRLVKTRANVWKILRIGVVTFVNVSTRFRGWIVSWIMILVGLILVLTQPRVSRFRTNCTVGVLKILKIPDVVYKLCFETLFAILFDTLLKTLLVHFTTCFHD